MIITDFNTADITFTSAYDLYDCGRHPEDGMPLEGRHFFVLATCPGGHRFTRTIGRCGWTNEVGYDGYPYCFYDHEAGLALEQLGDALADKLNETAAPHLNPEIWVEVEPAYGSKAYQAQEALEAA